MAARTTGTPLWMAAWTNEQGTLGCPGTTVLVSGDVFDSGTLIGLPDCTIHDPALTWDPSSGRFILLWINRTTGNAPQVNNDRLFARTTFDGFNWTAPQDLVEWSPDAASAACYTNGDCILTYGEGRLNVPLVTTRRFRVVDHSTGFISTFNHSSTGISDYRTPSAAVHASAQFGSFSPEWMTGLHWSSSLVDYGRGHGTTWGARNFGNPMGAFSWQAINNLAPRQNLWVKNGVL